MEKIKRFTHILRKLKFDKIQNIPISNSPIEGFYRYNDQKYLCDTYLDSIISGGFNAFDFSSNNLDPFSLTVQLYSKGECKHYQGSPLEHFYNSWQPQTLAQVAGLPTPQENHLLSTFPENAPPFPWDTGSVGSQRAVRLKKLPQHKVRLANTPPRGFFYYGPADVAFGEATFNRLVTIYESINRYGYQPNKYGDYIKARVLMKENKYKVFVRSGKHRIAVLRGMEYKKVPILYGSSQNTPSIVRREDSFFWANVISGFYSETEALQIFDRIFNGVAPVGLQL
jgi:hypothetical protein